MQTKLLPDVPHDVVPNVPPALLSLNATVPLGVLDGVLVSDIVAVAVVCPPVLTDVGLRDTLVDVESIVLVLDAFISIATSSHRSPTPLAVQLHVAVPGDGIVIVLEAPVIVPGMLTSQCCVQVGEPSVAPPYIAGKSATRSFGYAVVIDTVGLPGRVL